MKKIYLLLFGLSLTIVNSFAQAKVTVHEKATKVGRVDHIYTESYSDVFCFIYRDISYLHTVVSKSICIPKAEVDDLFNALMKVDIGQLSTIEFSNGNSFSYEWQKGAFGGERLILIPKTKDGVDGTMYWLNKKKLLKLFGK